MTKNVCSIIIRTENEKMFEKKWGEVMERRTQRRVVRKSRKIRKNTFVLLTMALILCLGTLAMGGEKGVQTKTYYECVQVQKGDTLWDIAKKYLGNGSRYPEIKELNDLKSNTIYSGWKLKIPN